MTVRVEDFPGCCSANVLVNFGQSSTSEFGYRHKVEYAKMRMEVVDQIGYCVAEGNGVVVAITTDEQKVGIKVLTDLGFIATQPLEKKQHRERTIQLWHLPVKGWVEPQVGKVDKPLPKRDANGRFAKATTNIFVKVK